MSNGRMVSGEFVKLVQRMRDAQKAYFRNRYRSDLQLSKRLEARVDAWLEKNLAEVYRAITWSDAKKTDETSGPYEVVDGEKED